MKGYRLFSLRVGGSPAPIPPDAEAVILGEEGRGRSHTIIPIVGTGEFVRPKRTDTGVVLIRFAEIEDSVNPCVVAINSHGAYQKGRDYSVPEVDGLKKLTKGYSADGIAGRAGGGEHALCLVQPGTEFELKGKYSSYWYTWDGQEWSEETPSERDARLALAEVDAGGGEWL